MNSLERQREIAQAFRAENAIIDLAGLPFTQESADVQRRIILGEITCEEAIQMKIKSLKQDHGI